MSEMITVETRTIPANFGPLRGANGNARITGPCGDTMEFWIRVENGIIEDASYTTDGCYFSSKCGATAAFMATGAPDDMADKFTQEDILTVAGDIERESAHCGLLAADTLRAAISDYRARHAAASRSGLKKSASARSILAPRPKLIVSCRGSDGANNALVVVYAGNCSFDPPMVMVGVVPSRHSWHIIKETGCFVVNLVSPAQKEMYDYFGSHSGRDGDKFAATGARHADGIKVNAPLLLDCPVNIECTVVDTIRTGSHDMFVGRIDCVHADEELVASDGSVDWTRLTLL